MMKWKRIVSAAVCVCMAGMLITGCGSKSDSSSKKRIIRVALSQSEEHPEYKGMETFKKYVEEKLGDKYEVQLYPNELLGGQTKAIELTQTGAIDFTIAGTPNLEIFADVYEVFSMPYLFTSEDAYFAAMNDTDYMNKIYASTEDENDICRRQAGTCTEKSVGNRAGSPCRCICSHRTDLWRI